MVSYQVLAQNMVSDIDFLFTDAVSKAFNELMSIDHKDELKLKHCYYNIARAMKKSLKDIDNQIDSLVLGKHSLTHHSSGTPNGAP